MKIRIFNGKMGKLEEVLRRRYPDLNLEYNRIAGILSEAAKMGTYKIEDSEDVLFFEGERLLLPKSFYQEQSWDDRKIMENREYVMPECIRNLISRAERAGEWNPEYAVRKYLEEIEEEKMREFLKFFVRLKEGLEEYSDEKSNVVSGELITLIGRKMGLEPEEVDRIRGEFKKGGIISPCSSTIRGGCLEFEINPSLLEK
ncbi:hypothetical protein AKJ56_00645 [candidate division MSBL1 archaeon SCGC-AAA382N08]|uniref:Uncharacterized protein n=1 Tax=candidate division MSBL1 archaeon SCGC-AAA382N08 TaxID=1698285 RepID=A0A133VQF6_9EURY|nr:hypothetical protein AKJ56_00645 [candidate division MSBL1 archaeon SCGC-AAA382N08]